MAEIPFEPYTGQSKLRFWCQKVLPLVYDESLSYYELLCKVVEYLNNTITDVSACEDNITALRDAFVQLQDYVNEQLEDFAPEVEQIIDEMVDSGEFGEILADAVNGLIAGEYITTQGYVQFNYVLKDGKLYCATASTSGEWDATKWRETTVGADMQLLNQRVYNLNAGQVAFNESATYDNNTVGKKLKDLDDFDDNLNAGQVGYNSENTYDNATVGKELQELKGSLNTHEEKLAYEYYNTVMENPLTTQYFVDADSINIKFTLNAVQGILQLWRNWASIPNAPISICGFINFNDGNIGFYNPVNNVYTDALTVKSQKASGMTFVAGREYFAECIREIGLILTIRITDLVTMQTASYTVSDGDNYGIGRGTRGARYDGTDITTIEIKDVSIQPYDSKLLVLGDSWTEGNSVHYYKNQRYCALARDALNGKVFINGMGGARAEKLLLWLQTYIPTLVKPKYVLLQCGVNDTNISTYTESITECISIIKNTLHAIPILCTVPPNVGSSGSIYQQINNFVFNSGERYLDLNYLFTTNGDRTTKNTTLFLQDGTHPTVAGHELIFKELQKTIPELFLKDNVAQTADIVEGTITSLLSDGTFDFWYCYKYKGVAYFGCRQHSMTNTPANAHCFQMPAGFLPKLSSQISGNVGKGIHIPAEIFLEGGTQITAMSGFINPNGRVTVTYSAGVKMTQVQVVGSYPVAED